MGIGALLGGLATGYAGAAQQDRQRQFEENESRRGQLTGLLGMLATNPNVHPYTQTQAGNMALAINQPGEWGKPVKADLSKLFTPSNMQQQLPKPTTQTASIGPTAVGGPAPASDGPQAPYQTTGLGPVPPPPAMGDLQAGQRNQAVTAPGMQAQYTPPAPPPPPPGMFMSPEQQTMLAANRAQAMSRAQTAGPIEARQEVIPAGLPPQESAGLVLGIPSYLRSMNTSIGSGQGFAKDLRAQGYDVPANIKDDQYVAVKELAGGRKTYEPTKAPGEVAGGNGTMLSSVDAAKQKAAVRYGYWSKENQTQFGQKLALQDRAFQNSIMSGDYRGAKQIIFGADKDYAQAKQRMHTMDDNLVDAEKPGSAGQQAQLSLLMNHIGMTGGAQKGMRVGKATIEEAQSSTPWLAGKIAHWFHQDENGDYIFDGPKGGVNLTKDQMEQMVALAHQKVNVLHDTIGEYNDTFQPELGTPGATRGTPQTSVGSGKGKKPAVAAKPSSAPPAPPQGVRKPLSDFEIH